MLRRAILGLGVGTLCAALAALAGVAPVERVPEPQPQYLALGGALVDLAAEGYGPGCFAPMLDELQRHPNWSIRIDDMEWNDYGPDEHHASMVIDGAGGFWREATLPQSLTLTEAERREALAAFALDCRLDEELPYGGYSGHYVGVALGEDGPMIARITTNSHVADRFKKLFERLRGRHLVGRDDDLRGFSLELTGMMSLRDENDRPVRRRNHIVLRERDLESYDLESRVSLLDWAMTRATSLPDGDGIFRGTLRAYGTSRPIAVALEEETWDWMRHRIFSDLRSWAEYGRR
jgi:hypothetical protein